MTGSMIKIQILVSMRVIMVVNLRFVYLTTLFFAASDLRSEEMTPLKLSEKVIESANAIKSYHIKYHFVKTETIDGAPVKEINNRIEELWWDGTKLRYDQTEMPKSANPYTRMRCRDCIQPGFTTFYNYLQSPVTSEKNDTAFMKGSRSDVYPEPRMLGHQYYPYVNWHKDGVKGFFNHITDFKTVSIEWDDQLKAWNLNVAFPSPDSKVSCRIRPQYGFKVDRILMTNKTENGDDWRTSVDTDYQLLDDGKSWYPKTSVYQIHHTSDKTTEKRIESFTVLSASLNQPIDPAVFTYAGFQIPKGIRIVAPNADLETAKVWSGVAPVDRDQLPRPPMRESVVPGPSSAIAAPQPAEPLPSTSRWIYYVVAAALGLSGMMLLFFRRGRS